VSIDKCYNVEDFRKIAKRKLPSPIYGYMAGGADDEVTLRQNTTAFDTNQLVPNTLIDVSQIDTSVRVLGTDMKLPFYCSPSGASRLWHPDKELGVSAAAANAGIIYSLATFSTTSIEEIGAANNGPKMFQIYVFKDRELSMEFVHRAKEAKFDSICITVDSSISGNRERDLYTGLSFPPKLTPSSFFKFAAKPAWSIPFMTDKRGFEMSNIAHKIDAFGGGMNTFELAHSLFDVSVTWKDIAGFAAAWDGPFALKGIQSVGDARKAIDVGATAIIVSNHGGRQLDGMAAPIDRIATIRDAVGDKLEIIADSGFRRGTHMLKAIAMGADACSFARPYIYALAAGGQAGVARMLNLLREEVERDMALLGVTSIDQISEKHIFRSS